MAEWQTKCLNGTALYYSVERYGTSCAWSIGERRGGMSEDALRLCATVVKEIELLVDQGGNGHSPRLG